MTHLPLRPFSPVKYMSVIRCFNIRDPPLEMIHSYVIPVAGHSTELPSVFQCSDGNSTQENSSLKRVAVVEDFFDIIYAMHVEMGADPGRAPKHAGQKKTYKAVCQSPAMDHLCLP